MKMRWTVLFSGTLLLCAMVVPLCAQGPGGPPPPRPERPEQELRRLNKKLKLNDEQKTKVMVILRERSSGIKALMDDQDTSMSEKFPQMAKLWDTGNSRIRDLLTPDQRATFDKLLAEEASRREHGPPDGPSNGPPEAGAPPPPQT